MGQEVTKNLPAIVDYFFDQTQVRTMFNVETQEAYVSLSDLLRAQDTSTHPSQVIPELEAIFGEGVKIVYPLQTAGGTQDVIFITEHAASFVVSRGRTETSKRLNRWLFTEVLPSIRKTGCYIAPGADVMLLIERERTARYAAEIAAKDQVIEAERRTAEAERGRADAWQKAAAHAEKAGRAIRRSAKPRRTTMLTDKQRDAVLELKASGYTIPMISGELGIPFPQVAKIIRDAKARAAEEVKNG